MSETDKIDNQVNEDIENLQVEVQSMQTLLCVSLMLFLIFTICINLFLGMQVSMMRDQVHHTESVENAFISTTAPQLYQFYAKVNDYASKHPDFKPIMDKYAPFFATHKFLTSPPPGK